MKAKDLEKMQKLVSDLENDGLQEREIAEIVEREERKIKEASEAARIKYSNSWA